MTAQQVEDNLGEHRKEIDSLRDELREYKKELGEHKKEIDSLRDELKKDLGILFESDDAARAQIIGLSNQGGTNEDQDKVEDYRAFVKKYRIKL